jgi:hypothetical protein
MSCREASSYHQWTSIYPQNRQGGCEKRNLPAREFWPIWFRVVPGVSTTHKHTRTNSCPSDWACGFLVDNMRKISVFNRPVQVVGWPSR